MRVGFIHPDLGLGGAERLIVDAAVALVQKGHDVTVYTSHFDPERCFSEAATGGPLDGRVVVYGSWIPRQLCGRLHIVFAMLRNAWLAARASRVAHDAYVCDQVSLSVPIVRALSTNGAARALFYCHFPDQLLSSKGSWLKRLYRTPFDAVEEWSTGCSDRIVVNSEFTQRVFADTFTSLYGRGVRPGVLYPCVKLGPTRVAAHDEETVTFLSINRFERKKNVRLAVLALAALRDVDAAAFARTRLVLAGGCDARVAENVEYHRELTELVAKEELTERVDFVLSFTDEQKAELLDECRAVLYTPHNEHFGIVPIECMAANRPVLAVESGGPLETVEDGVTGFHLPPDAPQRWAEKMALLGNDLALARKLGRQGRARTKRLFSFATFATQLDALVRQSAADVPRGPLLSALVYLAFAACVALLAVALYALVAP